MDKLTNLEQLRAASLAAKGLIGEVAEATAEALEEMAMRQQDGIPTGGGGVPSGCILIWSGAANAVPEGWALCDGENGTPDLRDRFVLGAGNNYSVGATGGEGSHTLTTSEIPLHSHAQSEFYRQTSTRSEFVPIYDTGGTATSMNSIPQYNAGPSSLKLVPKTLSAPNGTYRKRPDQSNVFATFSTAVARVISTYGEGGGAAHNNMPPYYALCYIMKL